MPGRIKAHPCWGCSEKYEDCYSFCREFQEAKKILAKEAAEKRKDQICRDFQNASYRKTARRYRKK